MLLEGLLSSTGKSSSMRVSMFMCVIAAIYFGYLAMIRTDGPTELDIRVIGAFLVAGIVGKVGQKYFEVKQ